MAIKRYSFVMSTLDDREPYPEPVEDEDGDYCRADESLHRIEALEQAIKDLLVCAQGIGWFPREAERWKHAATLIGQSHRVK